MFVSIWKRRMLVGDLQYRLMGGSLLYAAAVIVAFAAATLLDGTLSATEHDVVADELLLLHERVWFALPVILALCLFHSALISHRIAGPLLRFKQVFHGLARGDLSQRVTVRRHDYLREEASALTDMVRCMAARMRVIEDGHAAASATLTHLRQDLDRAPGRRGASQAEVLSTQMDRLGQQIRQFSVPAIAPERPAEQPSEPLKVLAGSV